MGYFKIHKKYVIRSKYTPPDCLATICKKQVNYDASQ